MSVSESIPRSVNLYCKVTNWTGSQTVTKYSLSWFDTRSGVDVPGWQQKIKSLQAASSEYSRSGVSFQLGSFNSSVSWGNPKTGVYRHESCQDGIALNKLPPASVVDSSKAYNTALGNFLVNANQVVSPFKGGIFLGELKDTLKMLRRPASALRDGFSAYLKRARRIRASVGPRPPRPGRNRLRWERRVREANKVLANSWLEYCYGWGPLMQDIKSAADAYAAYQAKVATLRVYGSAKIQNSGSSTSYADHHAYAFYFTVTTNYKTSSSVVFKGVVKQHFDGILPEQAQVVMNLSGFRIEEFVPTIWELIPYSFVVDYFTNVGDILNGAAALLMDWVWYTCATKNESTCESVGKSDDAKIRAYLGSSYMGSSGSGSASSKRYWYTRTIPVLSLPTLQLELPSSPWSWANLSALILSKVK